MQTSSELSKIAPRGNHFVRDDYSTSEGKQVLHVTPGAVVPKSTHGAAVRGVPRQEGSSRTAPSRRSLLRQPSRHRLPATKRKTIWDWTPLGRPSRTEGISMFGLPHQGVQYGRKFAEPPAARNDMFDRSSSSALNENTAICTICCEGKPRSQRSSVTSRGWGRSSPLQGPPFDNLHPQCAKRSKTPNSAMQT